MDPLPGSQVAFLAGHFCHAASDSLYFQGVEWTEKKYRLFPLQSEDLMSFGGHAAAQERLAKLLHAEKENAILRQHIESLKVRRRTCGSGHLGGAQACRTIALQVFGVMLSRVTKCIGWRRLSAQQFYSF
jgi:hypothetical protein